MKSKISELNQCDILDDIKQSKKISQEKYVGQKFERKAYLSSFNISDARMKFKLNSHMAPTIKMNFPSDPEFTRNCGHVLCVVMVWMVTGWMAAGTRSSMS